MCHFLELVPEEHEPRMFPNDAEYNTLAHFPAAGHVRMLVSGWNETWGRRPASTLLRELLPANGPDGQSAPRARELCRAPLTPDARARLFRNDGRSAALSTWPEFAPVSKWVMYHRHPAAIPGAALAVWLARRAFTWRFAENAILADR